MLRQVLAVLMLQLQLFRHRTRALLILLLVPITTCTVMWSLNMVANTMAQTQVENRCGCKCLECRDVEEMATFVPSPSRPCRSTTLCLRVDTTQCGLAFSTPDQAPFCKTKSPTRWPFMFQQDIGMNMHHKIQNRTPPRSEMYVTGDRATTMAASTWSTLVQSLKPPSTSTAAVLASLRHLWFHPQTYETEFDLGGIIATTPSVADALWLATPVQHGMSMTIETGIIGGRRASALMDSCAPFAAANGPGSPAYPDFWVGTATIGCTEVRTKEFSSTQAILDRLYCLKDIAAISGSLPRDRCSPELVDPIPTSLESPAVTPDVLFAVDYRDSSANRLAATIYVDHHHKPRGSFYAVPTPPRAERMEQIVNLVIYAWTKTFLGPAMTVRATGQRDMPRRASAAELDWNERLGNSFYVWTTLLLLPVVTRSLVETKVRGLRLMMKYHGLRERAFVAATLGWWTMVALVYTILFWGAGRLVQLAIFVHSPIVVVMGFLWMTSASCVALAYIIHALVSSTDVATAITFLYVLLSGLLGEYLFRTLHHAQPPDQPPWVEYVFHPATVYGGLTELVNYGTRAYLIRADERVTALSTRDDYAVVARLSLCLLGQSLCFILIGVLLDVSVRSQMRNSWAACSSWFGWRRESPDSPGTPWAGPPVSITSPVSRAQSHVMPHHPSVLIIPTTTHTATASWAPPSPCKTPKGAVVNPPEIPLAICARRVGKVYPYHDVWGRFIHITRVLLLSK